MQGKDYELLEGKRENVLYNIPVKYSYKSFGRSFINYLGCVNFNSLKKFCIVGCFLD